MRTVINPDGSIKVARPVSGAGDGIVLLAEEDVRVAVAACSVSESECNSGRCTALKVTVEG